MKARIKETGEIVEIYPDTLAGFLADDGCYYKNEELSTELDDWQAFRREAAKDILPSLIEKASEIYGLESLAKEVWCKQAVEWADELIRQLKD